MLRLQTTKTRTSKNRYFIAFFLKSNIGEVFINSCRQISNIVVLLDDLNKLSLQDAVSNVCLSRDGGVDEEHIIKYFKQSNFLICLMNHDDYSIAGFTYGHSVYKPNKPNKLNWMAFEVEILCGHNQMKSVGYNLTNILKLIVLEINKTNPKIIGFILTSVKVPSTLQFYDRQEIIPMNKSNPLKRFWQIGERDITTLRERLRTSRIQLKVKTPTSSSSIEKFEFLDRSSHTPTTPRDNFIELLTSRIFQLDEKDEEIILDEANQHPSIYKLSKKAKKLKTKKQSQIKKIQRQLNEFNYGVDSEDKAQLEDFIQSRNYDLEGETLIHPYQIEDIRKKIRERKKRIKTRKLRPRFRDSKNPYDVLNMSSSLSSSS